MFNRRMFNQTLTMVKPLTSLNTYIHVNGEGCNEPSDRARRPLKPLMRASLEPEHLHLKLVLLVKTRAGTASDFLSIGPHRALRLGSGLRILGFWS